MITSRRVGPGRECWFLYVEDKQGCKRISIGHGTFLQEIDETCIILFCGQPIYVEERNVVRKKRDAYQLAAQMLAAEMMMMDLNENIDEVLDEI